MNDDLISRKAAVELVITEYDRFQKSGGSFSERHELEKVIKMLQNMPTAFDKEKVIGKLERLRDKYEERWSRFEGDYIYGMIAYDKAIGIVKKGGR